MNRGPTKSSKPVKCSAYTHTHTRARINKTNCSALRACPPRRLHSFKYVRACARAQRYAIIFPDRIGARWTWAQITSEPPRPSRHARALSSSRSVNEHAYRITFSGRPAGPGTTDGQSWPGYSLRIGSNNVAFFFFFSLPGPCRPRFDVVCGLTNNNICVQMVNIYISKYLRFVYWHTKWLIKYTPEQVKYTKSTRYTTAIVSLYMLRNRLELLARFCARIQQKKNKYRERNTCNSWAVVRAVLREPI